LETPVATIAPILFIRGRVRQVSDRDVPAFPGRVGGTDPATGKYVQPAAARPAYSCKDITIDTEPGGLVEVTVMPEALAAIGGDLTFAEVGKQVDLPVRAYDKWVGPQARRFTVPGYSLAGEVHASLKAGSNGTRALASTPS
jgi:hypothetical protein